MAVNGCYDEGILMSQVEDNLAADAKYLSDKLTFWALNRKKLLSVTEEMERIDGECGILTYGLNCNLRGGKSLFLDFLTFMDEGGWKTYTKLPDEPVSYFSVTYSKDELTVYVNWSNTFCKQVQIGMEVSEKPVYRLDCTEDRIPGVDEDDFGLKKV